MKFGTQALRTSLLLISAIVFCPCPSVAGDVQSWSSVDYTPLRMGRVKWTLTGGFRLRDSLGDLYDRRLGTIVDVALGKGVSVSAGYMMRYRDYAIVGSEWDHRVTTALNYPVFASSRWLLKGATYYERFMGAPLVPDFNRYRQRCTLEMAKAGWSPLFYQDIAILQESGFSRSRSRVGLRWASRSGYEFSVAYQFETTNVPGTSTWLPRHTIVTSFEIDKPIWKSSR